MSNHQWAQAQRLDDPAALLGPDIYYQFLDVFGDPSFTTAVTDPPPDLQYYYLAAFYTYTPAAAKHLHVETMDTYGGDTVVMLYTRHNGSWQTVPAFQPQMSVLDVDTTAGVTYYLAFAYGDPSPTGGQLLVAAMIQRGPGELNVDADPVHVGVGGAVRVVGAVDVVDAPAVRSIVHVGVPDSTTAGPGPGGGGGDLPVPPISVHGGIGNPSTWSGTMTLSSPEDAATVATATPQFVVAVLSDDDAVYTVQVQYADNAAMSNPVLLTDDVDATDGGAILTPASAVPAHTYWRARLLQATLVRADWSLVQSFTVSTTITASSLPVSWTVSASAVRPIHLWHLDPAGAAIGDTVTVYGQGFPAAGHLSFGDQLLDVASWTYVSATDENSDDDTRIIDGDTVTCEHYEVTFVAPVYDGPGAALTVED